MPLQQPLVGRGWEMVEVQHGPKLAAPATSPSLAARITAIIGDESAHALLMLGRNQETVRIGEVLPDHGR